MKPFHWRRIIPALWSMALTCSLGAADQQEAPGYRESYPTQITQIEQLSVAPKTTRKGKASYSDTTATLAGRLFSTDAQKTNLILGARRVRIGLNSKIRPRNTLYGIIGVESEYTGIDQWNWLGNLTFQPHTSLSSIGRKMRTIASLDGRYAATEAMGIHAGFYVEAGMRATIVAPLIGLDYTAGSWLFQAIYPIKAGITYQGLRSHAFSIMIRPIYTAVRVHKGLHNTPSVATYQGNGAEFRWDFLPASRWNFWAGIGQTLGGSLSVGDKHNNHKHRIHLRSSPYFNVGLAYKI